VKGFEEYLLSRQFSKKGIAVRLNILGLYQEWAEREKLDIREASYNDLLSFMKHCRGRGTCQRTVQHYIMALKHFYAHLQETGQLPTNPALDVEVKGIKREKLYYQLSPGELDALYKGYPAYTLSQKRNKAMLGLLVYQGLTTMELAMLEVGNIGLGEGKIYVPGGPRGNGRELALEAPQVLDLYGYIFKVRVGLQEKSPKRKGQCRKETNLLFIGDGGNCYSISNFMAQVMATARKLNAHVVNARQVRASVIGNWLKKYHLRKVQYLAGHRYVSSTERYLQNDLEGLQKEVRQYHPLQ